VAHTIPLERVRKCGIAAHIDAGRQRQQNESCFTGIVHKIGEVHEGTAVTDWMEQGRAELQSLLLWHQLEKSINIIDTPGHVDFTIEVERSMQVLDGVINCVPVPWVVYSLNQTVWRQADRYNVPRIAFINKMDRTGANFYKVLDQMRDRLQ